jgi:2-oxoisovalerate dehydrogenase E1 component
MKPESSTENQPARPEASGHFTTHDLISPDGPAGDATAGDGAAAPAEAAPAEAAGGAAALADYEGDLEVTPVGPEDFEPDVLKAALRTMMTSRRLDDKMMTLLKQGKGYFHIGASGHEAAQVGLGFHLRGGEDWFCLYYRDLALALSVGYTAEEALRAHFAKAGDPNGAGRQMPEHFGHRELNIMTTSSSVGAQWMPAVGFGLAAQRDGTDQVVYAGGGEGSTSQGSFHEALNWAARAGAPVLFHVEDNKYAISVPVWEQTAGASIYPLLGGYPGLTRARYDGTDFFTAFAVGRAAVEHLRAGRGPVALLADVVRLLPHSSSDDHAKYRTAEDLEGDRQRDPIARLAARLVEAGVMTEEEVEAMRKDVAREIDALARQVEAEPDPDDPFSHVYGPEPDLPYEQPAPSGYEGDLVVMVDAINHALDEEMARDPRVLVYGEDVGGGKGGVFTATRGLTDKHGADRCFNSPLAETSILGSAVGLAAAGYRPVVEIQFADYIWPGMDMVRNQIAPFRYRSNGDWACPMVIRVPTGGYIHGGLCHSQNIEAIFGHMPGLKIALPSNAADAKGLLKTAIRGNDPVLFLEHKALYRQGPARRPEPHAEYLVPFGKASVVREGTDLTVVTWGAIVYKALNAAKALEKEGVSVEVIDLRSILPLDTEAILASVRKTNRVLVAYEDHAFMGFGAEIAAQVADHTFDHLDAPVKRVAGAFTWIPYADPLEKLVLPQDDDVLKAAREVLAY